MMEFYISILIAVDKNLKKDFVKIENNFYNKLCSTRAW